MKFTIDASKYYVEKSAILQHILINDCSVSSYLTNGLTIEFNVNSELAKLALEFFNCQVGKGDSYIHFDAYSYDIVIG